MKNKKLFNKNKIQKLCIILGMLLYASCLYIFQIGCPIRSLTGVLCPGCGMTRAWLAVLRLDFAQAFSYNAMFWVAPILCFIIWRDGAVFKKKAWNDWLGIVLALCLIVHWLYRMMNC